MLRLDRVSKFYSAGGVVSSGFSKVSLNFDRGEFVAITGESGSGKSTLLNVISGLDSFEEGEMYVEGAPTSGFSGRDMEDYRKKYIGNIFQTFNLINSYTVYQNVEMVLLLAGCDRNEIKDKVRDIIKKVGLSEYEKTKASKLSGGQKQRVAIARALARETPIIVADEPTGNLDSKSAADVIKLLHDVSEDKLVIIVTHNYDQVEPYVTRKITMHDGRVVEDRKIRTPQVSGISQAGGTPAPEAEDFEKKRKEAKTPGSLSFGNTLRLGVRNTFNLPAKFMLLLFVFLFLCGGTFMAYSSFKNLGAAAAGSGYTDYFTEARPDRIVVTKTDRSLFTDEDYEKLAALENVKSVEKRDLLMDTEIVFNSDEIGYYITAAPVRAEGLEDLLTAGRMPEADDEAIFLFAEDDPYISDSMMDLALDQVSQTFDNNSGTGYSDMKIVGYGYLTEEMEEYYDDTTTWIDGVAGFTDAKLEDFETAKAASGSSVEINIGDKIITAENYGYFNVMAGPSMEKGEVLVPEEMAYMGGDGYGKASELTLNAVNPYETKSADLKITKTYNQQNVATVVGVQDYEAVAGNVYISQEDYNDLFGNAGYQASVIADDSRDALDVRDEIEAAGFDAFYIYEAYASSNASMTAILNTFRTVILAGVLAVLFFVSYFIIKLIFKSRNSYFSIARMLGATKENCAALLRWDMFVVFNIAYFILAALVAGAGREAYPAPSILVSLAGYIDPWDYVILYAVLCILAVLLAARYSRQMFKKTAMNAHREEV